MGSSDAPVIVGASPWKTPLQLFEEKIGVRQEPPSNWAMQRGLEMEAQARAAYELLTDIEMPPALAEHPKHTFMRASLDGWNQEKGRILEIKCPGEKDHATAMQGKVPQKYVYQLVHQMMVTGSQLVDYFSFDGKRGVIVKVEWDKNVQEFLAEAEIKFWEHVQSGTPPEATERDFLSLNDNKAAVTLFREFQEKKVMVDRLTGELDDLKKKVIEAAAGQRVRCHGVQVMPVTRKGNVDYAKIPQLQGVDLDAYRKKTSTYFDVRLIEKKAWDFKVR